MNYNLLIFTLSLGLTGSKRTDILSYSLLEILFYTNIYLITYVSELCGLFFFFK